MKRMLWLLLCLAALLLTACGQKAAAQADPAVAAAQRYQPLVQAVGDGTSAGVDLTDRRSRRQWRGSRMQGSQPCTWTRPTRSRIRRR